MGGGAVREGAVRGGEREVSMGGGRPRGEREMSMKGGGGGSR